MARHRSRDSEVKPFAIHADSDEVYKLSHAPQFKNAKQYIQAKLIMLENDFYINPTESEINRAVRQIINDHWR